MTHQTPLDSVGHLHNLGLGEAVLLGGLLTHVLQQGHHGVEGGAVDKLRVGLTSLPLGLNAVSLLLHRLQSALLDRGVLEDGAVLRDVDTSLLTLQLSTYSILDPGISTSSHTFSVTGLQLLVVMVSSSVVQLGA